MAVASAGPYETLHSLQTNNYASNPPLSREQEDKKVKRDMLGRSIDKQSEESMESVQNSWSQYIFKVFGPVFIQTSSLATCQTLMQGIFLDN